MENGPDPVDKGSFLVFHLSFLPLLHLCPPWGEGSSADWGGPTVPSFHALRARKFATAHKNNGHATSTVPHRISWHYEVRSLYHALGRTSGLFWLFAHEAEMCKNVDDTFPWLKSLPRGVRFWWSLDSSISLVGSCPACIIDFRMNLMPLVAAACPVPPLQAPCTFTSSGFLAAWWAEWVQLSCS